MSRDSSVDITDSLRAGGSGDRIPVAARFPEPINTGPGAHPASYTTATGSLQRLERPRFGVDDPPHLAQRLKKGYSYTSTLPLGLRGLFYDKITLLLWRYGGLG